MTKYTKAQVEECKNYLNFSVEEGYLDEDAAQDLIRTKNWFAVYHMMDEGDYAANDEKTDYES